MILSSSVFLFMRMDMREYIHSFISSSGLVSSSQIGSSGASIALLSLKSGTQMYFLAHSLTQFAECSRSVVVRKEVILFALRVIGDAGSQMSAYAGACWRWRFSSCPMQFLAARIDIFPSFGRMCSGFRQSGLSSSGSRSQLNIIISCSPDSVSVSSIQRLMYTYQSFLARNGLPVSTAISPQIFSQKALHFSACFFCGSIASAAARLAVWMTTSRTTASMCQATASTAHCWSVFIDTARLSFWRKIPAGRSILSVSQLIVSGGVLLRNSVDVLDSGASAWFPIGGSASDRSKTGVLSAIISWGVAPNGVFAGKSEKSVLSCPLPTCE